MPIKQQPDSSGPLTDGLILAGGRAKRFAGKAKGLVEFRGQPMVARVANILRGKVERLMISANQNHSSYHRYADLVVADRIGDEWGPLAGIYTGLMATTADWLLVTTCDQPLLPADYPERMIELLSDSSETLIVATDAEREHFLNLLLPASSVDNLREFLVSGQRPVHRWLETVGYRKVEFPRGCLNSINSQAELELAEASSGSMI